MQWHGLKLPIIILAFACGLALAFGGQWIYSQYIYQQPLNKVLAENKLVQSYKVEDNAAESVIQIKLSNNSTNLMSAYQELNQSIGKVMGRTLYTIKIDSNSDAQLDEAYYESHFFIYQAQVNGNYPEVAQEIQQIGAKYGATGKVYVDQSNMYIQLVKPDGHVLNKVIPRQGGPVDVTAKSGGGQLAKGN